MIEPSPDPLGRDSVLRRLLGPEGPEGPELSCEQCFELLDEYVELELVDDSAEDRIPGMRAHLEGCLGLPRGAR